jgi:hypothetical protein
MFENNGFAFDSAGSFFGESTTPSFENGFSNAGPSDGFFGESAFDENGFSTPETSAFGESASYGGGFTQFGSAFCESAFGEDGFSGCDFFGESADNKKGNGNIGPNAKDAGHFHLSGKGKPYVTGTASNPAPEPKDSKEYKTDNKKGNGKEARHFHLSGKGKPYVTGSESDPVPPLNDPKK